MAYGLNFPRSSDQQKVSDPKSTPMDQAKIHFQDQLAAIKMWDYKLVWQHDGFPELFFNHVKNTILKKVDPQDTALVAAINRFPATIHINDLKADPRFKKFVEGRERIVAASVDFENWLQENELTYTSDEDLRTLCKEFIAQNARRLLHISAENLLHAFTFLVAGNFAETHLDLLLEKTLGDFEALTPTFSEQHPLLAPYVKISIPLTMEALLLMKVLGRSLDVAKNGATSLGAVVHTNSQQALSEHQVTNPELITKIQAYEPKILEMIQNHLVYTQEKARCQSVQTFLDTLLVDARNTGKEDSGNAYLDRLVTKYRGKAKNRNELCKAIKAAFPKEMNVTTEEIMPLLAERKNFWSQFWL